MASAVRLALDAVTPSACATYNVGSGVGTSMAEVVRAVEAELGVPVRVRNAPPKPEPHVLTADTTRVRTRLGWIPERSELRQIVADAWRAWESGNHDLGDLR